MRVSGAEDIGRSVFAEDDSMLKMLAGIIELAVLICALWILSFLSTFCMNSGMLSGICLRQETDSGISGSDGGKLLLNTKALTVILLVYSDFIPSSRSLFFRRDKRHGERRT